MKTIRQILVAVIAGVLCAPAAAAANDWENPAVFAEGRLAPRATAYP